MSVLSPIYGLWTDLACIIQFFSLHTSHSQSRLLAVPGAPGPRPDGSLEPAANWQEVVGGPPRSSQHQAR